MKFECIKTLGGFIPATDLDKEKSDKLPIGEAYEFEVKLIRNYEFHKKFFALLKIGMENSKNIDAPNINVYKEYALLKSGLYTSYQTTKGIMPIARLNFVLKYGRNAIQNSL
jgi:hypothetical protein